MVGKTAPWRTGRGAVTANNAHKASLNGVVRPIRAHVAQLNVAFCKE